MTFSATGDANRKAGRVNDSISLGRATSNAITGHTTPADAITAIQSGKWAKQIAVLRNASGDEADRLKKNFARYPLDGKIQQPKKWRH